ncbi:recombination regulator RecX [Tuberibacillus sp. Marseille-P3662]|uniref:recombination regulator RecX n=1 Tax=Tuberibacillus sp. Marseille-P3662 TaxID=1965358 RepID=UPI0015944857|nr:recombination regulator RecX [Tuberibacillus sp. Marseille-P3662]
MTYLVTKIAVNEKNKSHYHVHVMSEEGEETIFDIHEDVLVSQALRKDLELTATDMEQLKERAELNQIYQLAIHYLSYRMRTIKELGDHLSKKGYDHERVGQVVERLKQEKLLDDAAFAAAFVRSRKNLSNKGPNIILQELRQKGVQRQTAETALSEYPFQDQFDNALKAAQKKWSQQTRKSATERKQQVQAFLLQKGFTHQVIPAVVDEISTLDDGQEREAIQYQGEKALRKYQAKFEGHDLRQKVMQFLYRKGFTRDLIEQFLQEALDDE